MRDDLDAQHVGLNAVVKREREAPAEAGNLLFVVRRRLDEFPLRFRFALCGVKGDADEEHNDREEKDAGQKLHADSPPIPSMRYSICRCTSKMCRLPRLKCFFDQVCGGVSTLDERSLQHENLVDDVLVILAQGSLDQR